MALPLIMLAGTVAATSSLIAYLLESGKRDEAMAVIKAAQDRYGSLDPAAIERAAQDVLPPSELAKIKTDPALRQAQMNALSKMREIEDSGGFLLEDRAVLNQAQNETARLERANRQGILDGMAQRGVGGSGAELAASLASAQGAANRNSQAGLERAAAAQRRYFDAIRARGDMAGNLRRQDYDEQSNVARAQDRINEFNWNRRYEGTRDAYNAQLQKIQGQNNTARDEASMLADEGRAQGQAVRGIGDAAQGGIFRYAAVDAGGTLDAQGNVVTKKKDEEP